MTKLKCKGALSNYCSPDPECLFSWIGVGWADPFVPLEISYIRPWLAETAQDVCSNLHSSAFIFGVLQSIFGSVVTTHIQKALDDVLVSARRSSFLPTSHRCTVGQIAI